MKTLVKISQKQIAQHPRRGSTLIIVIALLGLLLFTGIVFFTFAVQEQRASEYFVEAAKSPHSEPQDVWGHMLEQLIVGPSDRYAGSKISSPMRRHSMIGNLFGNDVYPNSGSAVPVSRTTVTDINGDDTYQPISHSGLLNMVDSPTAWGYISSSATANDRQQMVSSISTVRGRGGLAPEPDAGYTYPDINTMFLAQRGYTVAEYGGVKRLVPYIIPSFFRPQLLHSAQSETSFGAIRTQDGATSYVPTDPYWAYAHVSPAAGSAAVPEEPLNTATTDNRDSVLYQRRHFRPHPRDIAGITDDGVVVLRYLSEQDATDLGVASGGFPFLPENVADPDLEDATIQGELGLWTGSHPLAYELDFDNDGDGIREGIALDLHYPVQEVTDSSGTSREYVVMYSMTVYDLDSLLNLNAHGNLAGLPLEYDDGSGIVPHTLRTLFGEGELSTQMISKSNLGLGPNEVNPIHALRRSFASLNINGNEADARLAFHLNKHFAAVPNTDLELANMVWAWLLFGRGEYDVDVVTSPLPITVNERDFDDIISGRFGDPQLLYAALEQRALALTELPRPGRSGNVYQSVSSGVSFGGRAGFDDNADRFLGEPLTNAGKVRGFRHPLDFSGVGVHYAALPHTFDPTTERWEHNGIGANSVDPRLPLRLYDSANSVGPERFRGYIGYSASSLQGTTDPSRYAFGADETYQGLNAILSGIASDTSDDLIHNPAFDTLFEDPLETIMDHDATRRPIDDLFGIEDLLALHLSDSDFDETQMSERLGQLAPHVFDRDQSWTDGYTPTSRVFNTPDNRQMFTTLSNDFRFIRLTQPFGSDMRPGLAGTNGGAGNPWDVLTGADSSENPWRWWEFSADSDGLDRDDDGYADGDGHYEFPPRFWSDANSDGQQDAADTFVQPFSLTDPFRPPLRRLLTVEAGEQRSVIGGLPISLNHVVSVDYPETLPAADTRRYRALMQRSGLRLRELTPHPDASEPVDASEPGTDVLATSTLLTTSEPHEVEFPPVDVDAREYWARLDRQRMARDIYVLLYTLGGARQDVINSIDVVKDYTGMNDPSEPLDSTEPDALYTHEQLRQMAQFAVNLVDAMDKDNVITKFEYDKNLGDGWGLDDNPYTEDFPPAVDSRVNTTATDALGLSDYQRITASGRAPEDSGRTDASAVVDEDKRGVVYGVESQELAFSEVFAFRSNQVASDHESTPYDDTVGDRDFLHIELQSLIPNELDLATTSSTTADNAIFRIVRMDRTISDSDTAANRETIREPLRATRAIAITDHVSNIVTGGERFSIAVASDTGLASSAVYVDVGDPSTDTFDGTFELISPEIETPVLPTGANTSGSTDAGYEPTVDLDIVHADHSGRFELVNGDFLEDLQPYHGNDVHEAFDERTALFDVEAEPGFDLVLQRRANPNLPTVDLIDNPWVEVDRIKVVLNNFGLADGDVPSVIFNGSGTSPTGTLYNNVSSRERQDPLDGSSLNVTAPKSGAQYRRSTIRGGNSPIVNGSGINSSSLPDNTQFASTANAANPHQLWQPHFDRDYTSAAELLNLPVYSPMETSYRLSFARMGPAQQADHDGGSAEPAIGNLSGAAAMFLFPDFTDVEATAGSPTPAEERANQASDNRWYRLFDFVEVPSRVNRMLGNYLAQRRLPGKVNLNTIRHLEVYAGLLDDPFLAELDRTGSQTELLRDSTVGGTRDRWEEFLKERDGDTVATLIDPTPANATAADVGDGFSYQVTLPGMPGEAKPFRSNAFQSHLDPAITDDNGVSRTIFRQHEADVGQADSHRQWLEIGGQAFHQDPAGATVPAASSTTVQRHQLLSKILNNTTNVSNTFIVYGTAAYYEAYTDPATGFVRVGGRIDLDDPGDNGDLTEDATENHDTGWQQRAAFVIDRTDALTAFDPASGTFDWQRLVKLKSDLPAKVNN